MHISYVFVFFESDSQWRMLAEFDIKPIFSGQKLIQLFGSLSTRDNKEYGATLLRVILFGLDLIVIGAFSFITDIYSNASSSPYSSTIKFHSSRGHEHLTCLLKCSRCVSERSKEATYGSSDGFLY